MNIARISEILVDCLGDKNDDDSLREGAELVDVWVEVILKPEKVREYEAEMIELLRDWPSESWGQSIPSLGEEISYMTAGAALGDQGMAFTLFAFGKLLSWWAVMEPCGMLGLAKTDPLAQQMAGMGMISITGYTPAETKV